MILLVYDDAPQSNIFVKLTEVKTYIDIVKLGWVGLPVDEID